VVEVAYAPRYSGSGYTAITSYLDAEHLQPIQNTYFNRRGEAMKTLYLGGYKSYGGGEIWRPHSLKMVDHTKGSSTEVAFSRFRADGADSSSFTANRFQTVS
jgi:Outer membrane lipoprotein-sorting protein